MICALDVIADGACYDIIVAGSGAAGMAAALFAAIAGKKVLLVERTEYVGGTSALSAATAWVPNTHLAKSVDSDDSPEKAARFLDGVVGNQAARELRHAFLASGAAAIALLEAKSEVKFRAYARHPDYVQEAEGATVCGRALEPVPFDGRALGSALRHVRPPIPEFTLFGGMMVDRTDINHLLGITKSAASLKHASGILARYGLDRLHGKRGTRLVMGNALIGRLLVSLQARGVDVVTNTSIAALNQTALTQTALTQAALTQGSGRIGGVTLASGATRRTIGANLGVICASGGFNRNPAQRSALLPKPTPVLSPTAPGATGEMQTLATGIGARFGGGGADAAFWAPVSTRQRADGSTAVFPHFVLDRGKPGTVCVNGQGRRFVNEAVSYHEFARAMMATQSVPTYLIADATALKKYGLGMVRPGARGLATYKSDGYLVEAPSLEALAAALQIEAANLADTIAAMNRYAKTGNDIDFGRGTTAYHRANGDAANAPNPNLGFIRTAPYYAVRLHPGDIGASAGLVTNTHAQVLGAGDCPIDGLYAIGNDMQSIMGGTYPGPGITIGPAIVFAYRAIAHATGSDMRI